MMGSFCAVIFTMVTLQCQFKSTTQNKWDERLPTDLKPESYELKIFSDIYGDPPKFWGTVLIKVYCRIRTNQIVLHQKGLIIDEASVMVKLVGDQSAKPIFIISHTYDQTKDLYAIRLADNLEGGYRYDIYISFSRHSFSSDYYGYKLKYYLLNDTDKWRPITYTLMEEMTPRQVFPCFDQMDMKATFTLRHAHPQTLTGLSNTKLLSSKLISNPQNWVMDIYDTTLRVATFNITFALLDYQTKIFIDSNSQMEIKVLTNQNNINRVDYVYNMVSAALNFFSKFYSVPYPFWKLDVIVQNNVDKTAGESCGVIYLSETLLTNAVEKYRYSSEYEMASAVCHMVNKQWIGILVTMTQWSENWLHIGLNLFLQTLCLNEAFPNFKDSFTDTGIINTFSLYMGRENKEFLSYLIMMGYIPDFYHTTSEKSVEKAYLLVRMMYFILGPEIFQSSITTYLEKFKYGNSSINDLWSVFTLVANRTKPGILGNFRTVEEMMESWYKEDGFPLITVTRNYRKNSLTVKQKVFKPLYDRMYIIPEKFWAIPLSYTTTRSLNTKEVSPNYWLTGAKELSIRADVGKNDWILFDSKINVMCRINYDMSNWSLIQKVLLDETKYAKFDIFTRARLVSDMFALAEIEKLPYKFVLNTMKYLTHETHYIIWKLAMDEFDKIRRRLFGETTFYSFEKYVRKIVEPVFKKEGLTKLPEYFEDNDLNSLLKMLIIKSACTYGVEACKTESLEFFKKWKNDNQRIPGTIHKTVLCQAIKHGNDDDWIYVWKKYPKEEKPGEKRNYLRALACSENIHILLSYLNYSIQDNVISQPHSIIVFQSIATNNMGYFLLRKFFQEQYNDIYALHAGRTEALDEYLVTVISTIKTEISMFKFMRFGDSRKLFEKGNKPMHDTLKKTITSKLWLKKRLSELKKYFNYNIFSK